MAQSSFRELLRRIAHALRLRGSLAADPTARTLHRLLLFLVGWMIFGHFVVAIYPLTKPRLLLFALGECGFLSALALLRLGSLSRASLVYLASTWVYTTLTVAFHTGINSPVLALYVTVPISAAWLLGFRGAIWTAVVCLSSALIFAVFKIVGVEFPRYIIGGPLGIWAILVFTVLIGSVPVAHVLKTLQAALAASRRAGEELQDYKEQLELLVAQRTEELVVARDQALAANHAKSAFLANMSHELRTPLNAILGFADLLRAKAASDEQWRDLGLITRSGENLLGLINDVLDMAKIESGGTVIETVAVDLHALLNDTADMLRDRARAKNLALLLEVHPGTPRFVRCDPRKLAQVLTNLLGNAVKYTEEGGIVLRAEGRPGDAPHDFKLIFEVEDTGIGIAPEDQARIFEPFVQAGGRKGAKGTGLGLSISRNFTQLLGGALHVTSTPGQGSRFCIELPVNAAEASEMTTERGDVQQVIGLEPGQPEYRVLIVEDTSENWLLLERLLLTAGFRTRVASDGLQAVESFRTWRPHFIWMDIRLPGLTGTEAAARIRQLDGGAAVKIAAVTASVFTSQRDQVLNSDFDDFVRKPYRPREIFDSMARHLGVRYLYAAEPKPAAADRTPNLRAEDLVTLPAALRHELQNALIALDPERIGLLAGRISAHDAELGSVLTELFAQHAYTPVLHALQGCDTPVNQAGPVA
jgi:signal transduction histidine kinase/DNA-binding response OmpR family regulator